MTRRRRRFCVRGHRLTKQNIYAYDRGTRIEHKCRECDRLRHRISHSLTPAHQGLVKLLAKVAVDEYLDEVAADATARTNKTHCTTKSGKGGPRP